ncbi:hypothetical protein AALP_AA8G053500, partial [Arabis alpina]
QIEGKDYGETFAPVAKMGTVRLVLEVAAGCGWDVHQMDVHQMDVHNAFLHGDLHEEVYMKLPPGFNSTDQSKVCRLKKSLYGLKQASRCWFEKLATALTDYGFQQSKSDYSLFTYAKEGSHLHVLVYVDDLIITGSSTQEMTTFKGYLSSCFHMKDLGPLKYFLGIEVARNSMGIYLSQRKYAMDILTETDLLAAKPTTFPLEQNQKLALSSSPMLTDPHQYRRLIGRLIYLTVTRPDLSYCVHVLAQFMQLPREDHWNAALRVVCYLKNSPGQGILLRADTDFQITGWCDSDWASCPLTRRSVTGYFVQLGNSPVSWKTRKQPTVSTSSTEAEYRAMMLLTKELIWLKRILESLGIKHSQPMLMYCDNKAVIHISNNPVFHERTKHVELDCHFVREQIQAGQIVTKHVPTKSQLADIFTKALGRNEFDIGTSWASSTCMLQLEGGYWRITHITAIIKHSNSLPLQNSHNIGSLSFGDVVDMLQAHELELESLVTYTRKTRNLALTCEKKNSGSDDDTDAVGLLVEELSRDKDRKDLEVQCFECKGFGHFKTDCPTVKRRELKYFGCKSLGHTHLECVNDQKLKKDRAMIFDEGHAGSGSDDDQDDDDDLVKSYKDVREALIRIGLENTVLAKEKLCLEAMVEALQAELQAEKNSVLKVNCTTSGTTRSAVQEDSYVCWNKTKQLDKILSYGRTEKSYSGLGYTGRSASKTENTKFVPGDFSHPTEQRNQSSTVIRTGCYFCGKHGHVKAFCYRLQNKIWVKKEDLLSTVSKRAAERKAGLSMQCNMAWVTEETKNTGPWYFDSGSSRHMTRDMNNLQSIKEVKGGKVTFGDGSRGAIKGKGQTCEIGLPRLMNVNLLQGLTANLISVSQLCDDRLTVIFTSVDCTTVYKDGTTVLKGIRSDNNCYMWEETVKCFTARDDLNLWHQCLGHMNARSVDGLFMGYSERSTVFRVLNTATKEIIESVNVVFDEYSRQQPTGQCSDSDSEQVIMEVSKKNEAAEQSEPEKQYVTEEHSVTEEQSAQELEFQDVPRSHSASDLIGAVNEERKTRGIKKDYHEMHHEVKRKKHQDFVHFACFVSTIEPRNHGQALEDEFWIVAMELELEQFIRNDVWELVPRPEGVNVVGTKWIFKNKIDENSVVVRNKARLIAQGYSQIEGVDFEETFASVARLESIRFFLEMACILNFKVFQMDKPKGFEDPAHPDNVYKLKKALYGLKQAPRAWYERLTGFLVEQGYSRGSVDKTLFILELRGEIMMVQIYVDDIIFGSTSQQLVEQFVKSMTQEFEMSMVGELKYFLGLQITQSEDGVFISQSTYAKNLLKRFKVDQCKEAKTPMSTTAKLSQDSEGIDVNVKLYRGMIGSLLYLTASRPDSSLSVGICARYQAKPKQSHLEVVKRIIKYVRGTVNLGIWYSKGSNKSLVGYCDADWAMSSDDRKSTSGGCFFLGNNMISWMSKKQNSVSLSTVEAEYITMGSCCTQLLWMKQMSADYGKDYGSFLVHCDNQSAIKLVEEKQVVIEHIVTDLQLADLFKNHWTLIDVSP